jgi:hypothetical protein
MALQSIFIVSIPRSGSTLLTNMLDGYADVICPPESFFPAVLNELNDKALFDKRCTAALFIASCSDGSPLTLEEATECIRASKRATLEALALKIAAKMGRNPLTIQTVVWKSTRMVGCWKFASEIGGKFIILHRNVLNVYESQFRVHFGEKNKNPARFALFAASYDIAFRKYPSTKTLHVEYSLIPEQLPDVLRWIGSSGLNRETSIGTLDLVANKNSWHSNINKPFENRDEAKLKNLSGKQIFVFWLTQSVLTIAFPIVIIARKIADLRQMSALRRQANELLKSA